ncbi:phenylalanine--tRNA ligase subunit beta [Candidatus Saccharibacteria bacterium RIFCSPHIGHO2_12_FULL_47_16b]|nr:MAG: phenylalanine--tRNA ligase subunit beta [Candidatus Saccharibacteria bacterium RIFCSPHIGHO2_12_FULL_47_16b]OGL40208.1 MAG: phenylalanine--tRNA ligase subunit beta [Candidatus Saccharibacteria bacterium RIFCSPLOWO2_02_FULL_46_7]
MKISLNWIKSIIERDQCSADPTKIGIDTLVEKIGAQLGAVEEVIDLGKKYEGIVVAKVESCLKHPNADKLNIALIDDGQKIKTVKRDKQGLVQVVHGAKNVIAGQLVAWMPPGATVPSTYDKDPFILEAKELRGVVSHGMIASAKELGLGDDHSGILVIDESAKPGQAFAKVFGLDDYIIDIENKMFTHRPDLFGQLGIARELAGIQNHVFKSPAWYKENPTLSKPNGRAILKLSITNQSPKLVPRFCGVVIKDVKIGESPLWLRTRLAAVGIKSINNIVDITNFLMMETAQPLHAYDYDKLTNGNLGARLAKTGEELTVLGGKKIKLAKEDIVITSGDRVVGLGGVMGGADTEVSNNTTKIVLEVANFDMNSVRKTAMRHGLFTEAASRFTKNQSSKQNLAVLIKAIDEIKKLAGGRQASQIIDKKVSDYDERVIHVNSEFVNSRLGLELSPVTIKSILENVEFSVGISDGNLSIKVPFWRTDIAIAEDIVEEVGRLYGYDHLKLDLPERSLSSPDSNTKLELKQQIRQILSTAGANEVLSYSFVPSSLLEKVGQDPKNSYHIRNALSPQLQYYRQTLGLNLIEKVHPNIKAGYDNFALFEIGKCYFKGELDKEGLPKELERIALVVANKNSSGSSFFEAKKFCDYLLKELGIDSFVYEPVAAAYKPTRATYYEPSRSAHLKISGHMAGWVGEFKPQVNAEFKLPQFCAGFDLHVEELLTNASANIYQPLNRFPSLEQDFCLRSATKYSYAELEDFMRQQLDKLAGLHGINYDIAALDIFQKPADKNLRQTTWRITLWHPDRTLTTEEANKLLDIIAKAAKNKLKAERV